jgi:repressor LexA
MLWLVRSPFFNFGFMLTIRQQQLLDFLREEQQLHGVMPSSREVQRHFGFASQTAAMDLLRALEKKGSIRRLPGKARAVILSPEEMPTQPSVMLAEIPIYGQIAAGMPQDSQGESEGSVFVDLDSLGISPKAKTFALRVQGNSMVDAHIVPGDLVVLEIREPHEGDVVAALIDGQSTLKRYLTKRGIPYLKAENADYPDLIPAEELLVQGVMVALVRRHQSWKKGAA